MENMDLETLRIKYQDAVELIDELDSRIRALLTCATSQDPIYTQEVYMREVENAEQALAKIKKFKEG